MTYGHAERNRVAIERLTRDTVALLSASDTLSDDEARWLEETTGKQRGPSLKHPAYLGLTPRQKY